MSRLSLSNSITLGATKHLNFLQKRPSSSTVHRFTGSPSLGLWLKPLEVLVKELLKRPIARWVVGVGFIAGLAAAWYLISPLFITNEVDDAFPMAASALVPDNMTPAEVEAERVKVADSPSVETTDAMPADTPTVLATGPFMDADNFHKGSGTATLYSLADGSNVVRLEEFEVTNGPDLHVLLSTSDDPAADLGEYLDLGSLKGNVGNQNYDIPADVDVSLYRSVIIYCDPFHVLFASALLSF